MALKKEVVEKLAALITGGLGLVAALAWNSAIQAFFERQTWLKFGGPWIYAVLVSVGAVFATIWIGRVASHFKTEEEKKK